MNLPTQRPLKILSTMTLVALVFGIMPWQLSNVEARISRPWLAALPIITNTLDVTSDSQVTSSEVMPGADNVPVLSFKLKAGRKDLKVQQLGFSVYYDANGDGFFGDYPGSEIVDGKTYYAKDLIGTVKLYDQNDVQIGSHTLVTPNGRATFTNLNYNIKSSVTKIFKVKVYIGADSTPNTVKKFAFDIAKETDVQAYNVSGPGAVKVNDGDGNYRDVFQGPNYNKQVIITVRSVSATQIFVNVKNFQDQTATRGQTGVKNTTHLFQSTGEDITIRKLTLKTAWQNTGTGGTLANPVAKVTVKFPTNFADPNNPNGQAISYPTGDFVTFTDLNFVVKASASENRPLEVYLDLQPNAQNSKVHVDFVGDDNAVFQAFGVSGIEYGTDDVMDYLESPYKTIIYQSQPYYATVTGINNCPTRLINYGSEVPIYCFSIRADSHGTVDVFKLTLDYQTQNISGSGSGTGSNSISNTGTGSYSAYRLYNFDNPTTPLATRFSEYVPSNIVFILGSPTIRIYPNETKYFLVTAPVFKQNPNEPSSITVKLRDDWNDISYGTNAWNADHLADQVWSDLRENNNHNLYSNDWYSAYGFETIPTDPLNLRDFI